MDKKNRNSNNYQRYNKKNYSNNHIENQSRKDYNFSREYKNNNYRKNQKHPVVAVFLFLTLLSSLASFGITVWTGQGNSYFFYSLISSLILVVFSLLFVAICVTNPIRKKGTILLGSFFLVLFHVFCSLNSLGVITLPSVGIVENFTGKSLTDVVSWASKNNITLNQDYEYSDMVPAYHVISQDVEDGTKLDEIQEFSIAVSQGPNPDKEIIIPSMSGWDSERVIQYVEDNYLSQVEVEFVESSQPSDTVIEQSASGSMKRSDALKIIFSLGEEVDNSDVSLKDLTGKSEFAAVFYLKQHRIAYELERVFSKKVDRGKVSKQSIEPGTMVKVNNEEDKVLVSISKGKSIQVPDLKNMSMVEITEWVIANELKLEFTNQYDDTVKEGDVISANYDEGDKIEQGTTIRVVISKGSLVMKDFDSLEDFRSWAQKYGVSYEEVHEFSEDVAQGEVISYSYQKGDVIKNGDSIIVTISDGSECKVPNLIGMSKKEVIEALEKVGLNYNFVTQNSSKEKNTAIKQSISAGSTVSSGTTITVTLSNGKTVANREDNDTSNSSSSNNTSSNNSGSNNSNSGSSSTPPSCDKSKTTMVYIYDELLSNNPSTTCSNIKNAYPNVNFSCQYVSQGIGVGLLVNSNEIDAHALNHCDTYILKIQQN